MAITLEWDRKFELGYPRIDDEHRIFLSLVRQLSRLLDDHADQQRIDRTLREIYKYADFHFLSEENLMEDLDYAALGEHRRHHAVLLSELRDLMTTQRTAGGNGQNIVEFLFEWFALHTAKEDRKFADHLAANPPVRR